MSDDVQYQQCPRCNELTEENDHFPCADGTAYHPLCYQSAMLEAGEADPFPPCDYCGQVIWQTPPVVKGQVVRDNEWVDALWHPECAPGTDEPEQPDRVDNPPEQPKDHEGNGLDAAQRLDPVTGRPICASAKCAKPIQRGLVMHEGRAYHALCAQQAGKEVRPRPICVACGNRIRPEAEVECEVDGELLYYDKKCYRVACLAAGMDDPFPASNRGRRSAHAEAQAAREPRKPKVPKVEVRLCRACINKGLDGKIPRDEFRAHVEQHEASEWRK